MSEKSKPNEIHLERVYDASLNQLWAAWTDPEQLALWWGPRGFSLTTHGRVLKPGGLWHYTMHGPDGTDYENKTLYLEVESHSRLVYDHGGNDERKPLFRVIVQFSESDGKAKMNMIMTLPTAEAAAQTRVHIQKMGGHATWDRLGEHLEARGSGADIFLINRTFQALPASVFAQWITSKQLARWLPPVGATMEFLKADIREGGQALARMRYADGTTLFSKSIYEVIRPHTLLRYTQGFCDEQGQATRFALEPRWPQSMSTTVIFAPEGNGATRVTVRWDLDKNATAEERAVFTSARGGMTLGWTGPFDKLEAELAASSR
jgi:uncharacterized protein YndB with AHSA1/START domain